jgi:hypothetical protein
MYNFLRIPILFSFLRDVAHSLLCSCLLVLSFVKFESSPIHFLLSFLLVVQIEISLSAVCITPEPLSQTGQFSKRPVTPHGS